MQWFGRNRKGAGQTPDEPPKKHRIRYSRLDLRVIWCIFLVLGGFPVFWGILAIGQGTFRTGRGAGATVISAAANPGLFWTAVGSAFVWGAVVFVLAMLNWRAIQRAGRRK